MQKFGLKHLKNGIDYFFKERGRSHYMKQEKKKKKKEKKKKKKHSLITLPYASNATRIQQKFSRGFLAEHKTCPVIHARTQLKTSELH